jgi:cell division protein YceG involved in septum cleavage
VRPQATKALYFVARGDGSSVFSETWPTTIAR